MKKYEIKYKEVGDDTIHRTSFIGNVDKQYVIDWFGLEDADVTCYEITETTNSK